MVDERVEQSRPMFLNEPHLFRRERGEGPLVARRGDLQDGLDVIEMGLQVLAGEGGKRVRRHRRPRRRLPAPGVEAEQDALGPFQETGDVRGAADRRREHRGDDLATDGFELERVAMDVAHERETMRIGILFTAGETRQQVERIGFVAARFDELPAQVLIRGPRVLKVRAQRVIRRRRGTLGRGVGIRREGDDDLVELFGGFRVLGVGAEDPELRLVPRSVLGAGLAEGMAEPDFLADPLRSVNTDDDIADAKSRLFRRARRGDARDEKPVRRLVSLLLGQLDGDRTQAEKDLAPIRLGRRVSGHRGQARQDRSEKNHISAHGNALQGQAVFGMGARPSRRRAVTESCSSPRCSPRRFRGCGCPGPG